MRGQHRRESPSPPEPRHPNLSSSQACERRSSTGDDWKGDDVSPSCKENGSKKTGQQAFVHSEKKGQGGPTSSL